MNKSSMNATATGLTPTLVPTLPASTETTTDPSANTAKYAEPATTAPPAEATVSSTPTKSTAPAVTVESLKKELKAANSTIKSHEAKIAELEAAYETQCQKNEVLHQKAQADLAQAQSEVNAVINKANMLIKGIDLAMTNYLSR